jgi:hypothetical protein
MSTKGMLILPCVLPGSENQSLTLRKNTGRRCLYNREVWETAEPKRYDIKTDLRKMHSKELHYFKSSLNITQVIKSRKMRWKGHVACMG